MIIMKKRTKVNTRKNKKIRFLPSAFILWTLVCSLMFLAHAVNVDLSGFNSNEFFNAAVEYSTGSDGSSISASGNVITITAKGNDNGTCGAEQTDVVTLTLTNKKTAPITFTLAKSDTVTIKTSGISTGDIELAAGGTIQFTVTSNSGASAEVVTGTITITGAEVVSQGETVTTKFNIGTGGTVTLDGTDLIANVESEEEDDHVYALSASATSGYEFYGWMSEISGLLSTNAETTYKAAAGSTDTIWPLFIKAETSNYPKSAVYYIQNASPRVYYGYLDEAIGEISGGGTVVVCESGTVYGSSNQTTFSLASGQQLLIPYRSTDTGNFGSEAPEVWDNRDTDGVCEAEAASVTTYITLTVPDGVTITSKGSINVNGQQNICSHQYASSATGAHGKLVLSGTNSKLVLEGGNLYCYGYITGTGTVEAKDSAVMYELFQLRDWRGGSQIVNWYGGYGSVIAGNGGNKYKSFPFSQYYVQNVEATLKAFPGVVSYVCFAVEVSGSETRSTAQFLGSDGLFNITDGYLERTYNATKDRMQYSIYGTAAQNGITVTIPTTVNTITLNSQNYIFPINSNMTIAVAPGSTFTINGDIKLLPDAKIDVQAEGDEEGHLILNSDLYIYDLKDWTAGNYTYNGDIFKVNYIATTGKGSSRSLTSSGNLNIDGALTVSSSGNIFTTSNGNSSTDKILTGKGTFINNGGTGTGELDEVNGNNADTAVTISTVQVLGYQIGVEGMTSFTGGRTYYGYGAYPDDHNLGEEYHQRWHQGVAQIGTTKYKSLAAAMAEYNNGTGYIQMIYSTAEPAFKLTQNITVDLNGCDVDKTVTLNGYTLYGADSKTDGYENPTEENPDPYGSITVSGGSVSPVASNDGKNYVAYYEVDEDGDAVTNKDGSITYSFHRCEIEPTAYRFYFNEGDHSHLMFQATFHGDSQAAEMLQDVGFDVFDNTNWYNEDIKSLVDDPETEEVESGAVLEMSNGSTISFIAIDYEGIKDFQTAYTLIAKMAFDSDRESIISSETCSISMKNALLEFVERGTSETDGGKNVVETFLKEQGWLTTEGT